MIYAVIAAAILSVSALYLAWRFFHGNPPQDIPAVLAYHKVCRFETGGTWISPSRFNHHIDSLIDSGYSFIDESAFIDVLNGKRTGSRSEILLTFDDGYSMLMKSALPALEKRSVPALIFLVTSYAEKDNDWELPLPGRRSRHMSWDEARDAASMGFSFGSHTRTHRDLTRMEIKDAEIELEGSMQDITSRLGVKPRSVSYPFGRTSPVIAGMAQAAGYEAGFTLYPPGKNGVVDPFCLRRDGVWVIDTPAVVRVKLSGSGLFWLEDAKGRVINAFARLTPALKRSGFKRDSH